MSARCSLPDAAALLQLLLLLLMLLLLPPCLLTVVDADVADVWVCEDHKLSLVAGVCHDLLVT